VAFGRKKAQITAGAEERRAAALGMPTEITGMPASTIDESPVTVEQALATSAVCGALNVIAGRGSTLPLQRWRGEDELPAGAFLSHPEADANLPLVVTLWQTLSDMCLLGMGYWRVLVRDFDGWPLVVRRLSPLQCQPRTEYVPGIGLMVLGWLVDGIFFD
jgi:hypothetical protein